jgi:hypothetical protein
LKDDIQQILQLSKLMKENMKEIKNLNHSDSLLICQICLLDKLLHKIFHKKKDYWDCIDEMFGRESTIRFIYSLKIYLTNRQKTFTWIFLELFRKNFMEILERIMKSRRESSLKTLLKTILSNISVFNTLEIKLNPFLSLYQQFLNQKKSTSVSPLGTIFYFLFKRTQ